MKNIKDRKIIIWDASEAGEDLQGILEEKKQSVFAFVDKKAYKSSFKLNGIKVESPEILIENKEKFYVFVAAKYYEEIEIFLNNYGYVEIYDYLYILHKPIVVEKNEEYIDIYGNNINGIKGTTIKFIGYNSNLKINSDCNFGENSKIYCVNGNINIDSESYFGGNMQINCLIVI